MKSLKIKSDNCTLATNMYGLEINGEDIKNIVKENLPADLEDYTKYLAKISISIEILGEDKLTVETEGYKLNSEDDNSIEDKELEKRSDPVE
jgi:hypothetical protein